MRRWRTLPCCASLLLCAASAVSAQQAPTPAPASSAERGWITFNVGSGTGVNGFTDTAQTPLYQETETITTNYPGGGPGVLVSGAGGYRVWRRLSAGVGFWHASHQGDATINASLPHPFFDNQPRAIEGTTGFSHDETGIDVKVGWTAPLSPRVRLILSGGPSIVTVQSTLVTGVKYSEAYPYDTAQFTSADTTTSSGNGVGVNAAADLVWLFSRHVGAGAIVEYTHAHVNLSVDGRKVPVDAGGIQGGGGIRFVF